MGSTISVLDRAIADSKRLQPAGANPREPQRDPLMIAQLEELKAYLSRTLGAEIMSKDVPESEESSDSVYDAVQAYLLKRETEGVNVDSVLENTKMRLAKLIPEGSVNG